MQHRTAVSKQINRRRWVSGLAVLLLVLGLSLGWTGPVFAAGVDVQIPVEVHFEGNNPPEETFTVELAGDGLSEPVTEQITLSQTTPQGTVTLPLNLELGIYRYTIKQQPGSHPDVRYSTEEYTYYVMVNNDGTVVQRATESDQTQQKPDKVLFTNTYRNPADDQVIGDPPVKIRKSIGGSKEPPTDREFQFVMVPEKPDYPLPEGYDGEVVVTVVGEGEVEIGNILFTKEGTYRYNVKEKHERVMGYYYDDAVFQVVYTVYRDGAGKLQCDRQIIKQGKEPKPVTTCDFENLYGTGLVQKVQTGDPALMVPVTVLFIISTGWIAASLVRHREEEKKRGARG